jgi:hypothetical protein
MFDSLCLPAAVATVPVHRADDLMWALAELSPGPALAGVLAEVDVSQLSDYDLVSYLSACDRQAAWAQAAQLAAIDELASRRERDRLATGGQPAWSDTDWTAHEVAAELRLSVKGAQGRLQLAESLRRLPDTFAMFARGALDLTKTRTIVHGVSVLDRAGAHAVEAAVLPRAADLTGPQLSAAVRRAVLRADPAAAERRHDATVRDRSVSFYPLDDGAAALWAVGPASDVQALYDAITALADRTTLSRDPGDDRTLDQRRFDVLTDAAYVHLEQSDLPRRHGRRPHLQVTVAATTLLGLDDNPAELAGYGPITAGVARRIAADADWTRLLTDPVSGIVTDYGTTRYRPPQSLANKILATHPTCRGLGCRQPASRCEIDHTIEYPLGPTADHNLGPRCKRCHRLKTECPWEVCQLLDGTFLYTSPAGHTYSRAPDPPLEIPPF